MMLKFYDLFPLFPFPAAAAITTSVMLMFGSLVSGSSMIAFPLRPLLTATLTTFSVILMLALWQAKAPSLPYHYNFPPL